ncbi:hypothetical protein APY94_03630 [Thermococcus celericrescens]|uniref:Peptidase C39-like domain-containing protein n=1 Tax=Thermococcus celericrescens TaxID=227598 RepID=A0A124EBI2_9EURY|nr:hypothetical protein [Thermococcus celericrescens]KUH34074.1 hypothetical protein APY94_03630 [Thermococcus celericrescens]
MNWKAPVVLLIGLLLLEGVVTAVPFDKPEAVPLATVKALALRELHKFPEFNGAIPTNPTPLYFPDGRLAAYEFRMVKNGKTIGYIIVSANRNLPPAILEAGFGEKTPSDLMKELATRKGVKTYRPAYFSGLNYGILTGDKIVDMKGREYRKPSRYTLALENKAEDNQKQWVTVETLTSTDKIDYIAPLATITSQKIIYGVPAWTSTDLGTKSNIPQPRDADPWEYIGPAEDPWKDWDGCAPIAASMIVGYYEIQYRSDWYREAIIDILHRTMKTSDDIEARTATSNIGPGIENFYWEAKEVLPDPPRYLYTTTTYNDLNENSVFSIIKNEVDMGRPGILSAYHFNFVNELPVNDFHSVTFAGYREYSDGTRYIYVHTTWAPWLNGRPTSDWVIVDSLPGATIVTVKPNSCPSGICPTSLEEVPRK